MINKIKCFTKNHKEYETYTIGRCKITKCINCNSIGIIDYKTDGSRFIRYRVKWLSKKELNSYLDKSNDTIRANAIKMVYNNHVVKDM